MPRHGGSVFSMSVAITTFHCLAMREVVGNIRYADSRISILFRLRTFRFFFLLATGVVVEAVEHLG